ncbi:hypothetical protein BUALT_BualtUnG0028600 [Buddleja alternifolia]|uniref:Putative GTP diphosphokinase RSH1, chloroplastic n=1 Tax=Buddleja alternifolia TaxID=168488 RepID=A0AAV6W038_9LAMI|nr:hypothetical protein BUALT_BualtUnG0028600 [Buddleja alternifolia]
MTSASSMSVSVECVNICKLWKGDVSGKYDCSVLSCASKAPRALTGFLASTAHPPQACGRIVRRNSIQCRSEVHNCKGWLYEPSDFAISQKLGSLNILDVARIKWKLYCSPSSSPQPFEISPDSLWEDLEPSISYLCSKELGFVRKALNLAFEAHDGQKRRSGEPFIIHPVAVAQILGELELDWESIAAGLLHDTVEDTNVVTFERIEDEFGTTVRHIVEGETKVSKLGKFKSKDENHSVQDVKAEDLRQMFLAMTEEEIYPYFVVQHSYGDIADFCSSGKTAWNLPDKGEPLQLSFCSRSSELENLAFMYTNPQDHAKIKRRVAELYKEHEKDLKEANKVLMKRIEDDDFLNLMTVKTEVRPVCKEPYSVYKTVLKSKSSINEVNLARICYHVLGLVHGIWTPVPRSMKDYIATPTGSSGSSLCSDYSCFYSLSFLMHLVRTEEMDMIAERGIAAHYSGKVLVNGLIGHVMPIGRNSRGKTVCLNNANVALRIGWLNAIREWQEEFVGNMSSREFVDTVTRDLLGSCVFVFTPSGEIKNLPKGATVIDYAYMIHTEIGNKMVAAKVNGNLVSPMHVLANTEVVEIISYNFLREQAALSEAKITADSVKEFAAESENDSQVEEMVNYSKGAKHTWEKILRNVMQMASPKTNGEDIFQFDKGIIKIPKVNRKHSKNMQNMSLKAKGELLSQGNGVAKMILANIPVYKEVLLGLEGWQASKIVSWHDLEGDSIQWLSIVCVDRKGMMADITSALAAKELLYVLVLLKLIEGNEWVLCCFTLKQTWITWRVHVQRWM